MFSREPNNSTEWSWIEEKKIWRKGDLMQSSEISYLRWLWHQFQIHIEWGATWKRMRYSFTNAKRLYNCSLWSPWSYFFYTTISTHTHTHKQIVFAHTEFYCSLRGENTASRFGCVCFFSHPTDYYLQSHFFSHDFIQCFAHDDLLQLIVSARDEKLYKIMLKYSLCLLWAVCLIFDYISCYNGPLFSIFIQSRINGALNIRWWLRTIQRRRVKVSFVVVVVEIESDDLFALMQRS